MNSKLQYRMYKIYLSVMFGAVILSVPLAFVLPVELSFENGVIENAQVVILILAALLVLIFRSPAAQMIWFQRFFAAGLFLMAMRELSWGRVFFPIKMKALGPTFVAMADYEYRIPVYIFLAVYIAIMLFILIRFVPVKRILLSRQPLAAFAVIFIALSLNYIGEHGYFIGKAYGQVLEELNELIFYLTLPVINFYYVLQQKNRRADRRLFLCLVSSAVYLFVHGTGESFFAFGGFFHTFLGVRSLSKFLRVRSELAGAFVAIDAFSYKLAAVAAGIFGVAQCRVFKKPLLNHSPNQSTWCARALDKFFDRDIRVFADIHLNFLFKFDFFCATFGAHFFFGDGHKNFFATYAISDTETCHDESPPINFL